MFEWWSALPLMKQFFLAVAIPSTVILVIQSIMTFAGMGGDHDMDGGGGDASGGHFDTGGGHFDVGNGHFDAADGHGDIAGHLHAGHAGSDFSQDGSHDVSGEHNQGMDGFRFFTIRGIVAFLSVFGWTGAALLGAVDPIAVFVISFLAGLTAMTLVGLAFWAILRLQASGNLDYTRSIGLQGEVYLTVPAGRSGVGKVNITLQETLVEVDAITDETEKLPTGSRIRVVGLEGNNVLLVSKEWEGHPHDT